MTCAANIAEEGGDQTHVYFFIAASPTRHYTVIKALFVYGITLHLELAVASLGRLVGLEALSSAHDRVLQLPAYFADVGSAIFQC